MSVRGWIFKKICRVMLKHSLDLEKNRAEFEKLGSSYKPLPNLTLEPGVIAAVPVEWARPDNADRSSVVVFLHGGSYTEGSIAAYRPFETKLAAACGVPVLSIGYRLAPENPFPAALVDVEAVYRNLLNSGMAADHILLLGDSAGGGLVAASTGYFRDIGLPLPNAIALISPWMDLTMDSEACIASIPRDPINSYAFNRQSARQYAGNEDLRNPLISPIHADFTGFPPMFIHCGTEDLCTDDAVRTAEKAGAQGIDLTWRLWKGMYHDFTIFHQYAPEGVQSFHDLCAFIRQNLRLAAAA